MEAKANRNGGRAGRNVFGVGMVSCIRSVIDGQLHRSCRPGYPADDVDDATVAAWLDEARAAGVRTIVCLLDECQLAYYNGLKDGGLLACYRKAGFTVIHRPVPDYSSPPVPEEVLKQIEQAFRNAEKPVLVHCSAGVDRTGAVVRRLLGS